jgi:hypothetical protein
VLARRDVLAMNLMPSSRDDDPLGCAPVRMRSGFSVSRSTVVSAKGVRRS